MTNLLHDPEFLDTERRTYENIVREIAELRVQQEGRVNVTALDAVRDPTNAVKAEVYRLAKLEHEHLKSQEELYSHASREIVHQRHILLQSQRESEAQRALESAPS